MDFTTSLLVSTNEKNESYNFIIIIVHYLRKMIYYKPVKVTIDTPSLAEVIIDILVRNYGIFESIIMNWDLLKMLYISKKPEF